MSSEEVVTVVLERDEDEPLGAWPNERLAVVRVQAGSLADGKLLPGDVVLAVNERPIASLDEFFRFVRLAHPTVRVRVRRAAVAAPVTPPVVSPKPPSDTTAKTPPVVSPKPPSDTTAKTPPVVSPKPPSDTTAKTPPVVSPKPPSDTTAKTPPVVSPKPPSDTTAKTPPVVSPKPPSDTTAKTPPVVSPKPPSDTTATTPPVGTPHSTLLSPEREKQLMRKAGYQYFETTLSWVDGGPRLGLGVKHFRNRVFVVRVEEGSAAAAVVRAGDRICDVDGQSVRDKDDTRDLIVDSLRKHGRTSLVVERAEAAAARDEVRRALVASDLNPPSIDMPSDVLSIARRHLMQHKKDAAPKPILQGAGSGGAQRVSVAPQPTSVNIRSDTDPNKALRSVPR